MSDVIERIARLKRLARDQAGTPEGELAGRIAAKLERQRNVEVELGEVEALGFVDTVPRACHWRDAIAYAICRGHGLGYAWFGTSPANLSFIGAHTTQAEYEYRVMRDRILCQPLPQIENWPPWIKEETEADSYRLGLATQIRVFMLEGQHLIERPPAESTALVPLRKHRRGPHDLGQTSRQRVRTAPPRVHMPSYNRGVFDARELLLEEEP